MSLTSFNYDFGMIHLLYICMYVCTCQGIKKGGLAAAGGAHDGEDLAGACEPIEAAQNGDAPAAAGGGHPQVLPRDDHAFVHAAQRRLASHDAAVRAPAPVHRCADLQRLRRRERAAAAEGELAGAARGGPELGRCVIVVLGRVDCRPRRWARRPPRHGRGHLLLASHVRPTECFFLPACANR
jgi:hypothetical protein